MSRSYHKNHFIKDHTRGGKKRANRKVRHTPNIPNGAYFKRCYQSWNICDFRWIWTKDMATAEYSTKRSSLSFLQKFPTLEDYLSYWRKCVHTK